MIKALTCNRCQGPFTRAHLWRSGPGQLCQRCRGRDHLDEERTQRAVDRTLRTLSVLRERGHCIICEDDRHAATCAVGRLELELLEYQGRINHRLSRKSQST